MNTEEYRKSDRFLVAVDCIIFGFDGKHINALLIKRGFEPEKGKWSLMGGFVNKGESADKAAVRILDLLTGMDSIYMEQLYCFSDVHRDPADRVISITYFALINIEEYRDQLHDGHEAKWFSLSNIPKLIFDHGQMVTVARQRLQEKASSHPIGFELLPEKFTLPQLQSLYEAIFQKPIDKRNFTRKVLSLGILNKLNEKDKGSSRKGAFYYVFNEKKYTKLAHEGMKFI
jgi:8-oxo-dGTP diphosphatase